MNNIRLINFRNIADSGEIELKPLTILVGKNGSGKSSFLRLFPLLQQSMEVAKKGPFLWYNEKGVDFGDFNSTVREKSDSLQVGFSIHHGRKSSHMFDIHILMTVVEDKEESINSEKGISYDRVSKIELRYLGNQIVVDFSTYSDTKVEINGSTVYDAKKNEQPFGLFPNISIDGSKDIPGFRELIDSLAENGRYKYRDYIDFVDVSFEEFQKLVSGKNLSYNIKELYCNIIYNYLDRLLMNIQMQIRIEMDNVTYIGPFREAPKRYYRFQNLATHKIDSMGSNMAVYVNAMHTDKIKAFNGILEEKYKFQLEVESHFGQISLFIKKNKNDKTNIVDNGFGYSQLMPVLLALHTFNTTNEHTVFPFRSDFQMLCIEQPELHLHPAMQRKIGSSLADSTKHIVAESQQKYILLETHSRSLIDSIGEAIASGDISSDNVAVYLFESGNQIAKIRSTRFDEDGYLTNWPLGFLD